MYYRITYLLYLKHKFNNNNIFNMKYNMYNHYNIISNFITNIIMIIIFV